MASINLSRGGQRSESKSTPLVGTVFLASVGVLGFVTIVYFGLLSYNNFVDAQMARQRTAIDGFKATMSSPEAVSVTDFSRRSEEVEKHLQTTIIPSDTLTTIEKSMLPDVTLTNYKRAADGTITLTLSTNLIKNIAQQLLLFKSNFDTVTSGKVAIDKDGIFSGEVTMMDKTGKSVVK